MPVAHIECDLEPDDHQYLLMLFCLCRICDVFAISGLGVTSEGFKDTDVKIKLAFFHHEYILYHK